MIIRFMDGLCSDLPRLFAPLPKLTESTSLSFRPLLWPSDIICRCVCGGLFGLFVHCKVNSPGAVGADPTPSILPGIPQWLHLSTARSDLSQRACISLMK